jgi:uncharacterized protein (DUF2147 family)
MRSGFGRRVAGLAAVAWGVLAFTGPAMAQPSGSPVLGSWKTQNGTEVTIAPCGKGYCGSLSWVVIPKDYSSICEQDKAAFGAQMLDVNNQDASLKTRKIVGMQMMTLKPTNDPRTFTGSIYNAEDGKTYDGIIWIVNNDQTLRLGGGCLGNICVVTQDWPRVPVRDNTPDFSCRP